MRNFRLKHHSQKADINFNDKIDTNKIYYTLNELSKRTGISICALNDHIYRRNLSLVVYNDKRYIEENEAERFCYYIGHGIIGN